MGSSTDRTDYCVLYQTQQEETLEHLFYTCSFSYTCWTSVGLTWAIEGDRFDWMAAAKQTHDHGSVHHSSVVDLDREE